MIMVDSIVADSPARNTLMNRCSHVTETHSCADCLVNYHYLAANFWELASSRSVDQTYAKSHENFILTSSEARRRHRRNVGKGYSALFDLPFFDTGIIVLEWMHLREGA